MSSSVHVEVVSLKHLKGVFVMSGILRMQAVKRAPRLISISDDGPIM